MTYQGHIGRAYLCYSSFCVRSLMTVFILNPRAQKDIVDEDNAPIPLPNVTEVILKKVVEFCTQHEVRPMKSFESLNDCALFWVLLTCIGMFVDRMIPLNYRKKTKSSYERLTSRDGIRNSAMSLFRPCLK